MVYKDWLILSYLLATNIIPGSVSYLNATEHPATLVIPNISLSTYLIFSKSYQYLPKIVMPSSSTNPTGQAGETTQPTQKIATETSNGVKTDITPTSRPAKVHLSVSTTAANQATDVANPEPKDAGEESEDWKSWH